MPVEADTTRVRSRAAEPRASSRPGRAYLTLLSGEGVGTIIALDKRRIGIGRGENADIRFRDDTISRNHAQLQLDNDGFVKLTDIGSSNGTFLNGVSVRSEVLRDGDRLAFGGDLVVDVRYGRPSTAAQATTERLSVMHISCPPTVGFEHSPEHYLSQLHLRERTWGTPHPSRAVILDALGGTYVHRGDLESALKAYEGALEVQRMVTGIHPTEQAQSHFRLARCLLLQGRLKDAQDVLDAGYALLAREARLRGEAFEFHLVSAMLLDLQQASRGQAHLEEARKLLDDIGPLFLAAKQALFNETAQLLSISPSKHPGPA